MDKAPAFFYTFEKQSTGEAEDLGSIPSEGIEESVGWGFDSSYHQLFIL